MNTVVSAIIIFTFLVTPSFAQELPFLRGGVQTPRIEIENNFTREYVKPGGYISGSFFITVPEGWHVYAFGEKKYHPLTFANGDGSVAGVTFSYPPADRVDIMGEKATVYEGRVEIIAEGTISKKASEGSMVWRPQITWQSCSAMVCLPPETRELSVVVNISN